MDDHYIIDAGNLIDLTELTEEKILSAGLTPREDLVLLLMFVEGLSTPEIVRQGKVLALQGRKQPVSTSRIHQIKAKALKKMRRRKII
jgi:DNA-directed RNA polymerase sigma subunit (sigma70/sigma32)